MTGLDEILGDVSSYLEWQLDEGVKHESVASEILVELGVQKGDEHSTERPALEKVSPAPAKSISHSQSVTLPHEPEKVAMPSNDSMQTIAEEISACTRCVLHKSRTNTVPGQGQENHPDILFVGEAPGADEDAQGIPFVGRSGQLLTKMIEAMGYSRETVFIANINKCRPPDNRKPAPDEMAVCLPFLKRQIALLQPKVIVALGATAVEGLVGMPKGMGITKVRGKWLKFEGIDLMPTFHPAYMLRNPNMKRPVWEDLKEVLRRLGKSVPPVKKSTS